MHTQHKHTYKLVQAGRHLFWGVEEDSSTATVGNANSHFYRQKYNYTGHAHSAFIHSFKQSCTQNNTLHLFICVSICHTVRFKLFFSIVLQVSNTLSETENSLDYVKISQETKEIQCREGKACGKSNKANLGRSRWLLMESHQQQLPTKQIKMWKLDSNIFESNISDLQQGWRLAVAV